MINSDERIRVALLAGSLVQGGAEKQLVYMARALRQAGVNVKIFSISRGEFYESRLHNLGSQPIWIGRFANPLVRLLVFTILLYRLQPHIIQSTHFFTNLYVTIAARILGGVAIGSIRNDTRHELKANGHWGPLLLHTPPTILANSYKALKNAEALGVSRENSHILPNVIDLSNFDKQIPIPIYKRITTQQPIQVIAVGRLVPAKRFDRFLTALAIAQRQITDLTGIIVGDGPERSSLEELAEHLGLASDNCRFLGLRHDVPQLLSGADIFVLTSDHEGLPNVILEAMAARLPVITTPAGDAGIVVQNDITGYVVPFDDVDVLAERMVHLARSPILRQQLGQAGRRQVEQCYSFQNLPANLLTIYRNIAKQQCNTHLLNLLQAQTSPSIPATLTGQAKS